MFGLRKVIFIKDIDPDVDEDTVNMGSLFENIKAEARSESPVCNTKIPSMITSLDSWPKSTNQLCHYCSITIDGVPAPAALSHDSRSGVFMLAQYVYCSLEHRLNELDEVSLTTSERRELIILAHKIAKLFGVVGLQRGVRKDDRKVFGGKFTDEEYKRRLHQINPS